MGYGDAGGIGGSGIGEFGRSSGNLPASSYGTAPAFDMSSLTTDSVAMARAKSIGTAVINGAQNLAKAIGIGAIFGSVGVATAIAAWGYKTGVDKMKMDKYVADKMSELGYSPEVTQQAVTQAVQADPVQFGRDTNMTGSTQGGIPIDQAASFLASQLAGPQTVGGRDRWEGENQLKRQFTSGDTRAYQGSWVEGANNTLEQLTNPQNAGRTMNFTTNNGGVAPITSTPEPAQQATTPVSTDDLDLWDEFMDEWDGTPSYAQTKAKQSFQQYFDTAKPGDTQAWAGGTLTMGADGVATYISPTGDPVEFTRNSDMQAIYENNPAIAKTWDEMFPTTSMKDAVDQNTQHMAGAANKYQNTIQGATDTQTANLDSLINLLGQATNKNNTFLQGQLDSAASGTGMFKPTTFMLGDQEISFVPGANRSLAKQLADASGAQLTGTRNYTTDASSMGQDRFNNINQTAGNLLATSPATSPAAAKLAYLQSLLGVLPMAETRRQSNLDEIYRNNALAQGLTISNNQLAAQEPGLLDWIKGAGSVLNTVGNINFDNLQF